MIPSHGHPAIPRGLVENEALPAPSQIMMSCPVWGAGSPFSPSVVSRKVHTRHWGSRGSHREQLGGSGFLAREKREGKSLPLRELQFFAL